jgi:hypothetical protein
MTGYVTIQRNQIARPLALAATVGGVELFGLI